MTSSIPYPPPRSSQVLQGDGTFTQLWSGWFRKLHQISTAAVNLFTATLPGIVPGSGGGTTKFLRADGTWATPSGGAGSGTVTSVTAGDGLAATTNPITVSGTLSLQYRFADSFLMMGG